MHDPIRRQYEVYPYPERDPADEARRLVTGSPSHLLEISHYLFGGRLERASKLRALVAGGGTGDAAIMLAQQLAEAGGAGRVVYLDLSRASRRLAEARARARGLDNIEFHEGSLLDVAALDLGPFDYVDCCGVLHHLEDPGAGLKALAGVLAPDGGMGLMLYGEIGRTGVYHVQEALRALAPRGSPPERVELARRLLANLPPTNWLRRNPYLADHVTGGDAGLHDLLLHARDRPYRVEQVLGLLADAGMRLVTFIEPARYEPATYLQDPELRRRGAGLDAAARAALAEVLAGNLFTHVLYAVRRDHPRADTTAPLDPDAVAVVPDGSGPALASHVAPDSSFTYQAPGLPLRFTLPDGARELLQLVDNRRTLARIRTHLDAAAQGRTSAARFMARFRDVYRVFNGLNLMLLSYPSRR